VIIEISPANAARRTRGAIIRLIEVVSLKQKVKLNGLPVNDNYIWRFRHSQDGREHFFNLPALSAEHELDAFKQEKVGMTPLFREI
jgi:hypothetical protein